MRAASFVVIAALAATQASAVTPRAEPTTITYETGACFGACPIYSLTIDLHTGRGEFVGRRYTAHRGPRRFRATPRQTTAFRDALAEVRALPGDLTRGEKACGETATDQASVTVSWNLRGKPFKRQVYFGCDMDANRALFDRITRAPRLLPVGDLIGKR